VCICRKIIAVSAVALPVATAAKVLRPRHRIVKRRRYGCRTNMNAIEVVCTVAAVYLLVYVAHGIERWMQRAPEQAARGVKSIADQSSRQ
jgi:hypothetical protein